MTNSEPGNTVPTTAAPAAETTAPVRQSAWKRWRFRLAIVLLPLVALVVAEAVLIGADVGDDLSLVVPVDGNPQRMPFQFNPRAGEPYLGTSDTDGPEPRRFDIPKPDDVYRIVVVGGSTVRGTPYAAELSFPRHLEVLLGEQLPDRRVEVLNAGMMSINSHAAKDVVRQAVADTECDLVVVHVGHNEFYGSGGVASPSAAPVPYPLLVAMRRTRLWQLASPWWPGAEPVDEPSAEAVPLSVEIALDGEDYRQAEAAYRRNLQQMVDTARASGTGIVLTAVASNLADHSPVSFLEPAEFSLEVSSEWYDRFAEGRELSSQGDWEAALEALDAALRISRQSSLLQYRRGQCLRGLGRMADAGEAMAAARDLDGCRVRAPDSFVNAVRDVADANPDGGVYFLDTEVALVAASNGKPLGNELFLGHVHFNLEGHYRLASALCELIVDKVLDSDFDPDRVLPSDKLRARLGATVQDELAAISSAADRYGRFPLNRTFDVSRHRAALAATLASRYELLDPIERGAFLEMSEDGLAGDLLQRLATLYDERGLFEHRLRMCRANAVRRPWTADVQYRFARCLASRRVEPDTALKACQAAVELDPSHAEAAELLDRLVGRQQRAAGR